MLATLLLESSAFDELPENFNADAFELKECKHLFESISIAPAKTNGPKLEDFIALFPDQRDLINDLTYGAVPLGSKFRSKAAALLNHKREEEEREPATQAYTNLADSRKGRDFEFELLNGNEIAAMEIPEQSYLVKNLISEHSSNILVGEEGCGKSLLAMNLAISVAVRAEKWLAYEMTKHGKVLYLNNELAFSDFGRRLKAMSWSLPARGDISNLIVPKEVPSLKSCWQTLNDACEKIQPCLVVLDCLYFAHDEDENDSSSMKDLMRRILSLRDKYRLAVLIVHHTKKGARNHRMHNDQSRGSNVVIGSADTVLQIRRSSTDERMRIIKPTKFRHVSDENRRCRLLSLDPENLWFGDEGETSEGDHIANAAQTAEERVDFTAIFGDAKDLTRKEIQERCKHLGYSEQTIDRLAKKVLKTIKYGHFSL